MAETPDFEQLAREISDNNGIGRLEEWDSETPDAVIAAIAEQLRLVWNARGAADEPNRIRQDARWRDSELGPMKGNESEWRGGNSHCVHHPVKRYLAAPQRTKIDPPADAGQHLPLIVAAERCRCGALRRLDDQAIRTTDR